MTSSPFDPSRLVSGSLDVEPTISAENLLQKFLIRWKFFAVCVLIVPIIAVALASLVPTIYKSSAEVLIRHEGGTNTYYSDVTLNQASLTGASAAEIIRSEPIGSQMIEAVGVEDSDIARPAYKVLFGKAAKLVLPLLGGESPDATLTANPKVKYIYLAKDLKTSIDAATLMGDRATGSPRDELIEVVLKSTNRVKVAAMVNGLCEAFIAEYNRRSRNEILAAYKTLTEQADIVAKEIDQLREHTADGSSSEAELSEQVETKPLASSMARTLSDLELRVLNLKQSYTDSTPEVVQATAELARARAMLTNQEAIDAATETYSIIKKKERQLLLAAKLAESDQSNITIVERGATPPKSKLTALMRYGLPGVAGLAAGAFLGGIGMILLNVLDPRIFVPSDIPPNSRLPLLGVIPANACRTPALTESNDLPIAEARPALLQALGKLDVLSADGSRVIVISSALNESPTASVALQLAALIARDRESRVLLIDANFDRPRLSLATQAQGGAGLLEVLGGGVKPEAAIRGTQSPRLAFLAAGNLALRDEAGSAREYWMQFLEHCRREYRTTVIVAGGLLNSREATPLSKAADRTILVTSRTVSTRVALKAASGLLRDSGAHVLGVVHCERDADA